MRYSVEVRAFGHVSVANVDAGSVDEARRKALDGLVWVRVKPNPTSEDALRLIEAEERQDRAVLAQRAREESADW